MNYPLCENMLYDLPECAEAILFRAMENAENVDEVKDELWAAINDELIYYDDQWDLMKYYFSPAEANLDEAMSKLYDDLWSAIDNGIIAVD